MSNFDRVTKRCIKQGEAAKPGAPCPYPETQLKERCSWLAGHCDAHGKVMAELASSPNGNLVDMAPESC